MNFRTWHLLMRGGFIILMPILIAGFLLPAGNIQMLLRTGGIIGTVVLGLTGATLALLLLSGKSRFACPSCKRKETRVLWSASGRAADLLCGHCGIFRECGPLRLKLKREPYTDEHGNPL
jgi:uncharacterized membrane protein YeaQ/YmgE (transglycosylase-associated protein family)